MSADGFSEEGYEAAQPPAEKTLEEESADMLAQMNLVPNNMIHTVQECVSQYEWMGELREKGQYCDVTFVVQGVKIIAHRIVVSGWSRWLRGIVADVSADDFITLDVFEPTAFASVLDYMYGRPLIFSLSDADMLMKVIRRLEMESLEEHCWEYCMKIVSKLNCEDLHELADKYSCPPLKLAAWRTLQDNTGGYQATPGRSLLVSATGLEGAGHGFTGPEENFMSEKREAGLLGKSHTGAFGTKKKQGRRVSLATGMEVNSQEVAEDSGDEEDEQALAEQFVSVLAGRENHNRVNVGDPSQLDKDAGATDIVLAWSKRLQKVYDKCVPEGEQAGDVYGDTYDDIDWYSELRHIYLVLNLPQKVEQIPQILATWAGKEDKMVRSYLFKYRGALNNDTAAHLESLAERLEVVRSVFNKDDLMEFN
jgi:hypothetical protein